jgi:signal transduction histidine kinase
LEEERARLFDQVNEGRQRLQALSRSLLEAQEAERRELARDLHDEIGQALTALKVNLQGVQRQFGSRLALPALGDSVRIVDSMLRAVRNLALDLRPSLLDDLGLGPALRWYLRRQATRFNWKILIEGKAGDKRYPEDVEIACFRVAQEAVTNIGRHAMATSVKLSLHERAGLLELRIKDNGIGFDPARALAHAKKGKSLGLVGMGERVRLAGGKLALMSSCGTGTVVQALFPLSPDQLLEERKVPR